MDNKWIKRLIWLYLILLIFEGSLRKWAFPSLADPLLVIRDPLVLLIYALALRKGLFPFNGFVLTIIGLFAASVLFSFAGGKPNMIVMLYGLRINYVHLPLIWVMGAVLDRKDVQKLGSAILLVAIPMTAVMVEQFRSPMNAFINRGVGDDDLGQIFGADGHIRPPGFFSFITGPQLFFPLAMAFFFYQATSRRQLPWLFLVGAGVAIIVALPVSISRTVMLGTALVGAAGVGTLFFSSERGGAIARLLIAGAVVLVALSQLPVFQEGRDAFLSRWQTAANSSDSDQQWVSIYDRVLSGLLQPFEAMSRAKFFGAGIGVGSNVGARLLSGQVGFMLAEDEWSKVFLELGPLLGSAFLLFRVFLTAYLGLRALGTLINERDGLPVLLFAACGIAIFQYQWGPPTVLGFAVFGPGLLMASLKPEPSLVPETETTTPEPEVQWPSPGQHRPAFTLKSPNP